MRAAATDALASTGTRVPVAPPMPTDDVEIDPLDGLPGGLIFDLQCEPGFAEAYRRLWLRQGFAELLASAREELL